MTIQRGATYKYPIQIKLQNKILPLDIIKEVIFSFDNIIIKKYPYSDTILREEDTLILSLTEKDTMSLSPTENLRFQARIVFNDGTIKFTKSKPFIVKNTQFTGVE